MNNTSINVLNFFGKQKTDLRLKDLRYNTAFRFGNGKKWFTYIGPGWGTSVIIEDETGNRRHLRSIKYFLKVTI